MVTFVLLSGIILTITGIILFLRGMWLRRPDHPSLETPSSRLGWAMTIRPWRYKQYWDGNGYKYDLAGRILFTVGILISLTRYLI